MRYSIATNRSEVNEAWSLVYENYLREGFITQNPKKVWSFPHYKANNSLILLAKTDNEVVNTMSVVLDSENGLPLDEFYHKELNEIRARGEKIVEVGLNASRQGKGSFRDFLVMMKILARFGCQRDHYSFVIGVNPKKGDLYKRLYNFQKRGEDKDYTSLNNAPVCLMYTKLDGPVSRELEAVKTILSDIQNSEGFDFSKRYLFASNKTPQLRINGPKMFNLAI